MRHVSLNRSTKQESIIFCIWAYWEMIIRYLSCKNFFFKFKSDSLNEARLKSTVKTLVYQFWSWDSSSVSYLLLWMPVSQSDCSLKTIAFWRLMFCCDCNIPRRFHDSACLRCFPSRTRFDIFCWLGASISNSGSALGAQLNKFHAAALRSRKSQYIFRFSGFQE